MTKYLLFPLLVLSLLGSSCGCSQAEYSLYDLFEETDSTPPVFVCAAMLSQQTASLDFNERIDETSIAIWCEENQVVSTSVVDKTLIVQFAKPLAVGTPLELEARVEDIRGNSLQVALELWAMNSSPASVLINEFTTKGSETNPDRVELVVIGRGNLAGITLYAGVADDWSDRFVFPDRWVERGTHLVVSFAKGVQDASDYVSAFQAGLGSNNGCLSVALNPQWASPLLDAVVWGNMSTSTFEGFGSASLLSQVKQLYQAGHWNSENSRHAIDSNTGTATRSFCRDRLTDTNSSDDWYVCATKQATFGSQNSDLRHTP